MGCMLTRTGTGSAPATRPSQSCRQDEEEAQTSQGAWQEEREKQRGERCVRGRARRGGATVARGGELFDDHLALVLDLRAPLAASAPRVAPREKEAGNLDLLVQAALPVLDGGGAVAEVVALQHRKQMLRSGPRVQSAGTRMWLHAAKQRQRTICRSMPQSRGSAPSTSKVGLPARLGGQTCSCSNDRPWSSSHLLISCHAT